MDRIVLTITIIIVSGCSSFIFCNVDTLYIVNGDSLTQRSSSYFLKDLLPLVLPALTALAGFYFINRNVKRQLIAQADIVKKSNEINRKIRISEILSELLVELNPNSGIDYELLKKGKYLNLEHEKLVKQLIVVVNKSDALESQLSEKVIGFGLDPLKIKEDYMAIESIAASLNI